MSRRKGFQSQYSHGSRKVVKSPAHVIVHLPFSAPWQQGGASSGDTSVMGDVVLAGVTNPLVRLWIQKPGCSPVGVSVSDRKNKRFENTDGVRVTKPHVLPGKKFSGRFLSSTKYTSSHNG